MYLLVFYQGTVFYQGIVSSFILLTNYCSLSAIFQKRIEAGQEAQLLNDIFLLCSAVILYDAWS